MAEHRQEFINRRGDNPDESVDSAGLRPCDTDTPWGIRGQEMDNVGLLVIVLAAACVAITFYLRKDLARHGFNMWVFAGVPMFAISIIAFVLWQESPSAFYENLFFSLAALAMAVEFIGTFIAVSRGRR